MAPWMLVSPNAEEKDNCDSVKNMLWFMKEMECCCVIFGENIYGTVRYQSFNPLAYDKPINVLL